jgi:hypothetical protein
MQQEQVHHLNLDKKQADAHIACEMLKIIEHSTQVRNITTRVASSALQ